MFRRAYVFTARRRQFSRLHPIDTPRQVTSRQLIDASQH